MSLNEKNLLAILGPTNTGKTYLAFEKLFSYSSGIFGFPLRLLARENYDKAVKKAGLHNVALITGEEKIVPREAKYFFCTVESMPTNLDVDCIIIDEVQLASDYERGHVFTDRILNLRGNFLTVFLGALTIKNILLKLFPDIQIQQQQRFSKLSYIPKQNFSKLKPRTAIIAFNINKVYEIAENFRTHKGGAAVVLGSLSPRTRNAQVEVYENKNVDYLVATDAIGMGLNLNIDHVCFSSLEKFDGKYNRNLLPHEIGQIAGRAGRYKNDGTFGYSKGTSSLDPLTIQLIESHDFPSIQKIYWRNSNLNFSTIETLLRSLKAIPTKDIFIHKKNAEDEINFRFLVEDFEIKSKLVDTDKIKLLWDVCRIPDFEKVFNDNYLLFLKKVFLVLYENNNKIPEYWINDRVSKINNFHGEITELSLKISQIRTWTYISNHQEWLENQSYWKEKTAQIENSLSDNLHTSLTNKFIDSSSKYFINSAKQNEFKVEVDDKNIINLDGKVYGSIRGFDLIINQSSSDSLFSLSHVKKSIRNMIEDKISNFLDAPLDSINLGSAINARFEDKAKIYWGDEQIGSLSKGSNIYSPIATSINSEFMTSENKILISSKLQHWIDNLIKDRLKPIRDDLNDNISPNVRAISFNCFENLASITNENYQDILKKMDAKEKSELSKLGIRIGAKFFFSPNFLKKYSIELCAILWKVFNDKDTNNVLPLPTDGRVSFVTEIKMPLSYWNAIGYLCIKNFALRVDIFERVFYLARQKIKYGPFVETPDLMSPVGCNSDQLKEILVYCGFSFLDLNNNKKIYYLNKNTRVENKNQINKHKSKVKKNTKTIKKGSKKDPNSPFAVLEKLL